MLNTLKMELETCNKEAQNLKYEEDTLGDFLLLFKLYPNVGLCETNFSWFQSSWGSKNI